MKASKKIAALNDARNIPDSSPAKRHLERAMINLKGQKSLILKGLSALGLTAAAVVGAKAEEGKGVVNSVGHARKVAPADMQMADEAENVLSAE